MIWVVTGVCRSLRRRPTLGHRDCLLLRSVAQMTWWLQSKAGTTCPMFLEP